MNARYASLFMMIAAIFWGTNPALIKLADWTPIGTAWVRAVFCSGLMLIYLAFTRQFSFKSMPLQLLSGGFLALNSVLFVAASTYTSAANAVVLMFIFPWITMLLDFFVNKHVPRVPDLLRLVLGLAGVILIVYGDLDTEASKGNIIAVFAGLCIALHIFFSQRIRNKHGVDQPVINSVFVGWLLSFIVFVPLIDKSPPEGTAMAALVIFGVLSAIPWLLWSKSIAHISGHIVAAILGIEVFFAALFAWLLLNEFPSTLTWIGGSLTLIAAMSQVFVTSKSNVN